MTEPTHIPVMLSEVVDVLSPRAGETFVDCTAGLGGHAEAIARLVGPAGLVVLNDLDQGNLARAVARLKAIEHGPRVLARRGNFADVPRYLAGEGVAADMVLADLGFASSQVDDGERGFSFGRDGPLDMRMDLSQTLTARDLVNGLSEGEIERILREFGEEPAAGRIARKLVRVRAQRPISTTGELAEMVRSAVAGGGGGVHPATRTFQALRIAVNDELGSLEAFLSRVGRGEGWQRGEARMAMITFHSLEDRPVKRAFSALVKGGVASWIGPDHRAPSPEEVAANPRARSAKLRAIRLSRG
jgi:16S rRNA (cytosine1402-N4)-methyltransferase